MDSSTSAQMHKKGGMGLSGGDLILVVLRLGVVKGLFNEDVYILAFLGWNRGTWMG